MGKLISNYNQLRKTILKIKKSKKKIVHCHGVFDLLHIGHINHFKEAKSLGDILFVSITADKFINKGPSKPLFQEINRADFLASISFIDFVFINKDESSEKIIELVKPDIYCKGPDYKKNKNDLTKKIFKEKACVENFGGKIHYTRGITYSSSNIINKSFDILKPNQKKLIKSVKKKYTFHEIKNIFESILKLNVLVVGETIIDQYNFCEAVGKSGKEPVMVFKDLEEEKYLGGSLSIGRNISPFCNKVKILTTIGEKKEFKDFIIKNLEKNISTTFIAKKGSPTIIKKRYIDKVSKSKLFGVYNLNDSIISKNEEDQIIKYLKNLKRKFDLIIISDFGHGMMTKKIVKNITGKGVFVSANSQLNSSNKGYHDLNKYLGVDCIVINDSEIRYELRDQECKIELLMKKLKNKMKIKYLIVTRGSEGAIILDDKNKFTYSEAYARNVVDKIGAGDTLLSITSLFLKKKFDVSLSLLVGSLAAAFSVEKIGNNPLKKINMIKSVEYLLK